MDGLNSASTGSKISPPLWLLAELTYSCPLQCPYCSNPLDIANYKDELGYYTNLITSGAGLDETRIAAFKEAGLDHIQLSFQASDEELNIMLAGTDTFQHKLKMPRLVKQYGYPMVLCFVLHRHNTDQIADILDLAIALEADYVELATTQYYGWAHHNKEQLLPTREQIIKAEKIAHEYQEQQKGKMRIFYVAPDYFEDRPKAFMNGWGNIFLTITLDGTALPCHSARLIPDMEFPNVRDYSIEWIWNRSNDFNKFRGFEWMKESCRSCDEKEKDFGGCRCQALMLTGGAANADPVCTKPPYHQKLVDEVNRIEDAIEQNTIEKPLVHRTICVPRKNSVKKPD